jgi:hypothetical protein
LIQMNVALKDDLDELVEGLHIQPFADPRVRAMLMHVSSSGAEADVCNTEEDNFIGTVLLREVAELFGELASCSDVSNWLEQNVPPLLGQYITLLSSGGAKASASAVDLNFLFRLFPLFTANKLQLVTQLAGLVVQLLESSMQERGREFVALELTCCHLAGNLLNSGRAVPTVAEATGDTLVTMQSLLTAVLSEGLSVVCTQYSGCLGSRGAGANNPHTTSLTAVTVLYYQSVVSFLDLLEVDREPQCVAIKHSVVELLQRVVSQYPNLPVEVLSLLLCTQEVVQPHVVAQVMVNQCIDVVSNVHDTLNAGNIPVTTITLGALLS